MTTKFLKWLYQKDEKMMIFIHRRLYNPKFKSIVSFLSHPPGWRILVLLISLLLFISGNRLIRLRIGLLFLSVLLSDQTCNLLKAVFKRVRPNGLRRPEGTFWEKLGQYSFPSSHAANNFCLAVLVSRWAPYLSLPLFIWAFLVAFSRICLKNHYPLDVFVGALIGTGYGLLFLWMPWIA